MEQEPGISLDGDYPVLVPYFMKEIIEQVSMSARRSKFVDQQSGVSARFSIANYRTMVASARQRGVKLGEKPAVPRISDLGHLYTSSLGKLELDMMGSQQMSEKQVLDAIIAEAIGTVFGEYVEKTGLEEIAQVFGKGVKIEVGDLLPSSHYADRLKRVPKAWEKAFEVNPGTSEAVRASCVEFVLAGLYASDRISRSQRHGWRVTGLTLSPVQRAWARASAVWQGAARRTRFLCGDAEQAAFPDAAFDVVWNVECSEHFFDKPAFFRKAAGWLRPGGRVAL